MALALVADLAVARARVIDHVADRGLSQGPCGGRPLMTATA
jgi:hypothetical protein